MSRGLGDVFKRNAPADEPDNTEIEPTGTEENPAWES